MLVICPNGLNLQQNHRQNEKIASKYTKIGYFCPFFCKPARYMPKWPKLSAKLWTKGKDHLKIPVNLPFLAPFFVNLLGMCSNGLNLPQNHGENKKITLKSPKFWHFWTIGLNKTQNYICLKIACNPCFHSVFYLVMAKRR